jgi:hypothetical protein
MNDQESFWAHEYAIDYQNKNNCFDTEKGVQAWRLMLRKTNSIDSILECGSNIGRNIEFINIVLPDSKKSIIERDSTFPRVPISVDIRSENLTRWPWR